MNLKLKKILKLIYLQCLQPGKYQPPQQSCHSWNKSTKLGGLDAKTFGLLHYMHYACYADENIFYKNPGCQFL